MSGSYFSDWLLKRGTSLTFARKTPIIIGLTVSGSIILANYVTTEWVVICNVSSFFIKRDLALSGACHY